MPKAERFKLQPPPGSSAPYYHSDLYAKNSYKKGWGFGYTKKKSPFNEERKAYIPSPERYHNSEKKFVKSSVKTNIDCTFGVPYSKIIYCDINNKKNIDYVTFENVGPLSYMPDLAQVKKSPQRYTLSQKFPRLEEVW